MGSIRNAPSGRWQARYRDGHGRPRSKTFRTKAEARRFLERNGTSMQRGDWVDPRLGRITFAAWATEWERTTVDLRPTTVHLYLYILRTLEEQLKERAQPGSSGLVFVTKESDYLRRSNFRRRYWLPAVRHAGLDGLRFHDLRHTAVALAIANGAHAKSIQARMGHSSVSITLDRYGHLLPSLDDQIAEGLERMYRLASIERTGARPVSVAELQPVTQSGLTMEAKEHCADPPRPNSLSGHRSGS